MKKTKLFFVLGLSGSGKTEFSQGWVKYQLSKSNPWCLLDKDTVGDKYSYALMTQMGLDPMDRDSDGFKKNIRDFDYLSTLDVARENLALGVSVICPAPWTKELKSGILFSHEYLNIDKDVQIMHIYVECPVDKIKQNIIKRNHPKDNWKLNNWSVFEKSLICPEEVIKRNILRINIDNFSFEDVERKLNAN